MRPSRWGILTASIVLVIASASQTFGQARSFEKVLIPITSYGREVPGAGGSRWVSTLSAHNRSGTAVEIANVSVVCPITCVPGGFLGPNETGELIPAEDVAAVIGVDASRSTDIAFALRVSDVSRQAENWGTAVPPVREKDILKGSASLVDIPVTAGFRHTLRLYDIDALAVSQIKLTVWGYTPHGLRAGSAQSDVRLGEQIVTLRPLGSSALGYLQISDVGSIASINGYERITIDLEPITSGLRYFALVSITNNATQQVTIVAPQ